jgi:3-hydroxyacyl-[acyl-carrier-protein] dehydratase
MPAPLFDLDALDLTQPIADKAALYAALKQRGTFEVLDGVLYHDLEGGLIVGYTDVRKDAWWAKDHIPGRPLYPGALMIEGAAQLCTYDVFLRKTDLGDQFVGFGGVDKTRFRGTVEPDCRLILAGKTQRLRSRMFTYAVQGFVERKIVFEGEVLGVIV